MSLYGIGDGREYKLAIDDRSKNVYAVSEYEYPNASDQQLATDRTGVGLIAGAGIDITDGVISNNGGNGIPGDMSFGNVSALGLTVTGGTTFSGFVIINGIDVEIELDSMRSEIEMSLKMPSKIGKDEESIVQAILKNKDRLSIVESVLEEFVEMQKENRELLEENDKLHSLISGASS
jgi:hypothetical protein